MHQVGKFLKVVDGMTLWKGFSQGHILSITVNYKYLNIASLDYDRTIRPLVMYPILYADDLLLSLLGRRENIKPVKEHPQLRSVSEAGVSGLFLVCPVPKQYWHADPLPMDSKYNTRGRMTPTFIDSIDKPAYKDVKVTFWTDYRTME